MKYPVLTQDQASSMLQRLRDGETVDHKPTWRGSGDELPLADVEKLIEALEKVRAKFPKVLKHDKDPDGGRFEAEGCIALHKALDKHFDALMLADYDFWTWLAVAQGREIVEWRHGGQNQQARPSNFGMGNRRENLFYRMWLRADVAKTNGAEPYELAKLGDQDFWRSHVLRVEWGRCRPVVHELIRLQFPKPGKPKWKREAIRELAKRLRRANATLVFECLDGKAAARLIASEAKGLPAQGAKT